MIGHCVLKFKFSVCHWLRAMCVTTKFQFLYYSDEQKFKRWAIDEAA